jgi:probable HAF family extracellular repeat protein
MISTRNRPVVLGALVLSGLGGLQPRPARDRQATPTAPSQSIYSSSTATAINDRGQVVGWSDTADGGWHTVLWQGGQIADLGTLPGHEISRAAANADA